MVEILHMLSEWSLVRIQSFARMGSVAQLARALNFSVRFSPALHFYQIVNGGVLHGEI